MINGILVFLYKAVLVLSLVLFLYGIVIFFYVYIRKVRKTSEPSDAGKLTKCFMPPIVLMFLLFPLRYAILIEFKSAVDGSVEAVEINGTRITDSNQFLQDIRSIRAFSQTESTVATYKAKIVFSEGKTRELDLRQSVIKNVYRVQQEAIPFGYMISEHFPYRQPQ